MDRDILCNVLELMDEEEQYSVPAANHGQCSTMPQYKMESGYVDKSLERRGSVDPGGVGPELWLHPSNICIVCWRLV